MPTITSEHSPREIIVRNPATGGEIARFSEAGAAELRDTIQHARSAQLAWAEHPLRDRKQHVALMRDWLVENADHVAETISRCMGKTRMEALAFDVMPSVFGSAWYEKNAGKYLAAERLPSGSILLLNKRSHLFRKPLGVIGIISPWNYPLGIPMHEIIPALLAGNSVVFKTAPETLPVGNLIAQMCAAAELPEYVFNHVIVDGPLCGDVMLEPGGVNKLFFTGSVRVGKILAEKAARNLVPVSLELGGKDAMVVLDDADIERAARGAVWGGMQNCGQACAGVERVYVQRTVYEKFLAVVKQQVENLRVLGPDHDDSDIGVLTTDRQIETVKAHLKDAREKGAVEFAKVESIFRSARALAPTVLTNVSHNMHVMREETFGPVIGVMPFETDGEAVTLANDSPYGLTASVWSRNPARAGKLAMEIEAGAVMINDHLMSHGITPTPWGGSKDSGLGRGHGRFAFEATTGMQVVIHDRLGFARRNLWWYPSSKADYQGIKGTIVGFHGKGLARRTAGFLRLLARLPKMFKNR